MLRRALVVFGLLVALPYACAPVYRFPDAKPFVGSHFLNPYEKLGGTWQRANLHAHGRAWGGLTNGRRQSNDEVVRRYHGLGYAVAGISNYQAIAAHRGVPTIPIYEHGYNIGKHHQLAIGARRVDWFDFPLWQSPNHLQFVINRLAATADLVALAHPSSRGGYSTEVLRSLTGYQLLEVLNGPFRYEEGWDAALSSGHVVWAVANDDNHDLEDLDRLEVAWNMIDAPSASTADIVEALKAGRSYAVVRTTETASATEIVVAGVSLDDGTLAVTIGGEPSTFTFVGQDGVIRKTVTEAVTADYRFDAADTYIRTVIQSPRTAMYLNPVFRYDGVGVPSPAAIFDVLRSWLLRGSVVAGCLVLVLLFGRRRRARNSLAQDALAASKRETA